MKRATLLLLAISPASLLAQTTLPKPTDYPDVNLLAGSEGSKVYLKWVVQIGWIPAGRGFFIYRESNGTKSGPLNPIPITYQATSSVSVPVHKRLTTTLLGSATGPQKPLMEKAVAARSNQISALIGMAKNQVAGKSDRSIFAIQKKNLPRILSSTTFASIKGSIIADQTAKQDSVPPSTYLLRGLAQTSVAKHINLLTAISRQTGVTHTMALNLVPEESTIRSARMALVVGILSRDEIAGAMGSTFVDAQATTGAAYTYDLIFDDGHGHQYLMSQKTVTVGQDAQPIPPASINAVQTGVGEVCLDWPAASDDILSSLGVDTYNVYRTDSGHPSGILLNPTPIAKPAAKSPDGSSLVENWFTFADSHAPVGKVSYEVRMVDGLGRESAAGASTSYTVDDWATPPSPSKVATLVDLNYRTGNRCSLTITAPYDRLANYKISRIDADNPTQPPSLVQDVIPGGGKPAANGLIDINYSEEFLPDDHHYRYLVSSHYPGNSYQSKPTLSDSFGIPARTLPAAPTGLSGTAIYTGFLPDLIFPRFGIFRSVVATPVKVASKPLASVNAKAAFSSTLKTLVGRVSVAPSIVKPWNSYAKPNYGSNVNLKWTETTTSGAPFFYKVYRTDMTDVPFTVIPRFNSITSGFVRDATRLSPAKFLEQKPGLVAQTAPKVSTAPTTILRPTLAAHQNMAQSPVLKAYLASIVDKAASTTIMTAQTNSLELVDGIMPSHIAQDFNYVVFATNRWGAEGVASSALKVHVPPSLPPDTPTLVSVRPNNADRSQLQVTLADSPFAQEVRSYRVFRADLGFHTDSVLKKTSPLKPKVLDTRTNLLLNSVIKKPPVDNGNNDTDPTQYTELSPEIAKYVELPATAIQALPAVGGNVVLTDSTCQVYKDYAYRVMAVNSSNLSSGETAYLEGTSLPSSIAPPTLGTATFDKNGVSIPFTLIGTEIRYVTGGIDFGGFYLGSGYIQLFRTLVRTGRSDYWMPVYEIDASGPGKCVDDSPINGQTYKYRVVITDSFGNVSVPSNVVTVTYKL